MSFQDVFKSSFLENVSAISILDMGLALLLAFGLGLFIFFVYKKTYAGVMYSSSFGVTLVALTMITTLVILAVTSNVVLSLGMVGALSIVRFRTAIKEPLDIAFLFWSIAVGIVLAAGFIPLAVIGSVVIGRSVASSFTTRRSGTSDSPARRRISSTSAPCRPPFEVMNRRPFSPGCAAVAVTITAPSARSGLNSSTSGRCRLASMPLALSHAAKSRATP